MEERLNATGNSEQYSDYYTGDYHDDMFVYDVFPFEVTIYSYVWPALVILVVLMNVVVIVVLVQKEMRSPTNTILTLIAVSDSCSALVYLPSVAMVFSRYEHHSPHFDISDYESTFTTEYLSSEIESNRREIESNRSETESDSSEMYFYSNAETIYEAKLGIFLDKTLCDFFMISKFFLAMFFHSVSIFMTLFLGFQRFVSVAWPYRAQQINSHRVSVIGSILIVVVSLLIHVYHLVEGKAKNGMCQWVITDPSSDHGYLWFILLFRHLIPCILLCIFTVLFVGELQKSRINTNTGQNTRRIAENRRVTLIVVLIVIALLVPEVPYAFFLLTTLIKSKSKQTFDLRTRRIILAIYEIAILISFHVNVYIYSFLNRRFQRSLKKAILYPLRRAMGRPAKWRISRSLSRSFSFSVRKSSESDVGKNTVVTTYHLSSSNTGEISGKNIQDTEL